MFNFLLWLDVQVFRLITFGKARPNETISAAAWSLYLDKKIQGRIAVPVIDLLFQPWTKDHCRQAYLWQIDIYTEQP